MADIRPFPSPTIPDFAVPTIGMPMQVGDAHVVATVRCLCLPGNGNLPQTIRGLDAPAVCHECGRVYGITRVFFDRTTGSPPQIEVSVIGFAKAAESPLLNA